MHGMISWGPELETGIDVIDQQHRQLIDYMGELADAIASRDRTLMEQASRLLIDFLSSHNEYEESLLAAAGYSQIELHRQQHLAFRVRVHNFTRKLRDESNPRAAARQALLDLSHWLHRHIEHDCRSHAPCLRKYLQPQPTLIDRLLRRTH